MKKKRDKKLIIGSVIVLVAIVAAIFLVNNNVITGEVIDGGDEEQTTLEPSRDATCSEDDFGDYLTRGIVEYNNKEYPDKCVDSNALLETSCEEGVVSKNKVNCNEFFNGNGRCLEGACVLRDRRSYIYCHDSDNWNNDVGNEVASFRQGNVYIDRRTETAHMSRSIFTSYQDYCRDGKRLIERGCGSANRVRSSVIRCKNGCDSERRICTPDIGAEIKLFNLNGEEGYMEVRVGEPILISEDSYIENIGAKSLEGKIVAKIVVYWWDVNEGRQVREFEIAKSDETLAPGEKFTAEGWSDIAPTVPDLPDWFRRGLEDETLHSLSGFLEVSLVDNNGGVIVGDSGLPITGTMYLWLAI